MIDGIGIDIEQVSRFESICREDSFLKNNFTEKELDFCYSRTKPEIHLTGIFCAKEAMAKILGNVSLKEIEILHDKDGKPYTSYKSSYLISISHTGKIAVAVAVKNA